MNRGTQRATDHGVTKSRTQLSDSTTTRKAIVFYIVCYLKCADQPPRSLPSKENKSGGRSRQAYLGRRLKVKSIGIQAGRGGKEHAVPTCHC